MTKMSQKQKRCNTGSTVIYHRFSSKSNPIQGSQMVLALVVNFAAYIA